MTGVTCGERDFDADLVIVGVGILPETTLAAAAGLRCENGIWVDELCQTSDPNIYAAGDCTFHQSVRYGRRLRLESVDNAVEQAKTAASHLWQGGPPRTRALVLVGSVRPETADRGLVAGVRPDGHARRSRLGRFALYYLAQGELLAVDAINSPKDFMQGKKWIAERKHPDPVRLADLSVDLKTL